VGYKKFDVTTIEKIGFFEDKYSVTLPEDYKMFLLECNGCIVEEQDRKRVYVSGISDYIDVEVLFGIETGEKNCDIENWMDLFLDELLAKTLIIGNDIMQGLLLIINDEINNGIYYWDDSYNFEMSCDEKNTYKICDTFEEFLALLTNVDL